MHLARPYLNRSWFAGLLGILTLVSSASQAIMLNFSAELVEGTCDIDLNTSNLVLNPVNLSQLVPGSLLSVKPFTLNVRNCTAGDLALTPGVTITGPGGKNSNDKWLFRNNDSASGVGVMLIRPGVTPDYSSPAVGSGDTIELESVAGLPGDQSLNFNAGIACINAGCAGTSAGDFAATILFEFNYR